MHSIDDIETKVESKPLTQQELRELLIKGIEDNLREKETSTFKDKIWGFFRSLLKSLASLTRKKPSRSKAWKLADDAANIVMNNVVFSEKTKSFILFNGIGRKDLPDAALEAKYGPVITMKGCADNDPSEIPDEVMTKKPREGGIPLVDEKAHGEILGNVKKSRLKELLKKKDKGPMTTTEQEELNALLDASSEVIILS